MNNLMISAPKQIYEGTELELVCSSSSKGNFDGLSSKIECVSRH